MKKTVLLIAVALAGIASVYAQSLSLADSTGPLANNQTITRYGSPSADEIVSYVFVKNNTAAALNVKCKKVEISLTPNSMNLFCWGLCFAPSVYVSPDPLVIEAGATNSTDFSGHCTPGGDVGISTIRYVFFDADNESDTVCVNVQYSTYPLGIESNEAVYKISSPYPNPASDVVSFNYTIGPGSVASLVIRDIVGKTVKEISLAGGSGKITIPVSNLMPGAYFYSLVVNGKTERVQKFIVSR